MATVGAPTEQRFLLQGVRWKDYLAILDALEERHVRVTYDRGNLELMTISPLHEFSKTILAQLIEILSYELDLDIRSGGSFTFKREDLDRGLEPDECYWFRNEPLIRMKMEFDPLIDPPPDLVVEVEISRSVLDRMGILAALGVPEIWRFDESAILVQHLQPDGSYAIRPASLSFPWLPMAEMTEWVRRAGTMSERELIRSFVGWVRAEVAPRVRPGADDGGRP
jgi:Uma2 family endonuclease